MIDFVTHPYELPRIEYERSGTHSEPIMRSDFFKRYPDPLIEFYKPFDAIKLLTGAAYETASMLIYLAALFVAALPGLLSIIFRGKNPDVPGVGFTLETTVD